MKGMCQTCGALAPLEWFIQEPVRRQFEKILIGLPPQVQGQAFFYLSLFRPQGTGRSLTTKKALRLLTELRDLVRVGYVSKPGNIDRRCPPSIWASAMETMTNQRHNLTLPMPNHNYLCKVAYDQAYQADRSQEAGVRMAEINHRRPVDHSEPMSVATIDPLAKLKENWDATK